MRRFVTLDRVLYAAALVNLACVLTSCYPDSLLHEATGDSGANVVNGLTGIAINPANPFAWWQLIGGAAVLFAAGFGGPKAVRTVKAFVGGKPTATAAAVAEVAYAAAEVLDKALDAKDETKKETNS